MNERLKQILARKKEIRAKLEAKGPLKTEELDQLEKELRELSDEEVQLRHRQQLIDGIKLPPENEMRTKGKPEEKRTKETRHSIFDDVQYRDAFMNYVTQNTPLPKEYRADESTKTTDIGALVPPVTLNKLIEKIEAYGMIIPLVNKTNYRTGMIIPTATVKPVATWVGEGEGSPRQKKTLDTSITFGHFKLRCAVSVSLETEYMAYSAFEAALLGNLTEAMGKAIETAIISGTGTGQPTGILTDDTKGAKLAVAAIGYDTLINAEAALPMEYETGAVWCMTKKTFMQFAGMTDKNGQPIARVNYGIGGRPERVLLGRNVVLTNYLDNYSSTLGADKVFAFLYNFSDYTLNTNFQIGIKTYEDNETDDIIRKSIMVCDGKPVIHDSLVKLTGNAASGGE